MYLTDKNELFVFEGSMTTPAHARPHFKNWGCPSSFTLHSARCDCTMRFLLRLSASLNVYGVRSGILLSACFFIISFAFNAPTFEASTSTRSALQNETLTPEDVTFKDASFEDDTTLREAAEAKREERNQTGIVLAAGVPVLVMFCFFYAMVHNDLLLPFVDRLLRMLGRCRSSAGGRETDPQRWPSPPPIQPPSGIVVNPITLPARPRAPFAMLTVQPPADVEAGMDLCTVCLEDVWQKETVMLECGHRFHRDCLTGWLERAAVARCPVCQRTVARVGEED